MQIFTFPTAYLNLPPQELGKLIFPLTERRYHLKQLGIARNTFQNWELNDLIPYKNDSGWQKFSFVESIWLKCVEELREFGLPLKAIQKIKSSLWSPELLDSVKDYYFESIKSSEDFPEKEAVLSVYENPEIPAEIWRDCMTEMQFDCFGLIIYSAILTKANYCLLIDKNGQWQIAILSDIPSELKQSQREVQSRLLNESFITINLRQILRQVFNNENVQIQDDVYFEIASYAEYQVLEAIRSGKFEEINIKVKEGSPVHLKVKNKKKSNEILRALKPYLKKGKYQTIEFVTRDGQLMDYSEITNIKLNK